MSRPVDPHSRSRVSRWSEADVEGLETDNRALNGNPADGARGYDASLRLAITNLATTQEGIERDHAHRRRSAALPTVMCCMAMASIAGETIAQHANGSPYSDIAFLLCGMAALTSLFQAPSTLRGRRVSSDIGTVLASAEAVLRSIASRERRLERAEDAGSAPNVHHVSSEGEHRRADIPRGQTRRHRRFTPLRDTIVVKRDDGTTILARVVDISLSGVAIRGDCPDISIGDHVFAGSREARVVRLLPHGIACEFRQALRREQVDLDVIL